MAQSLKYAHILKLQYTIRRHTALIAWPILARTFIWRLIRSCVSTLLRIDLWLLIQKFLTLPRTTLPGQKFSTASSSDVLVSNAAIDIAPFSRDTCSLASIGLPEALLCLSLGFSVTQLTEPGMKPGAEEPAVPIFERGSAVPT
jgi:hypothetical protein